MSSELIPMDVIRNKLFRCGDGIKPYHDFAWTNDDYFTDAYMHPYPSKA